MTERVIILVDMDCFYCQVETRLDPSLAGKPVAVVQYNAWKGGGIIAVNYEARNKGVTRGMRGYDAKKHCPDIQLVSVPTVRDKADLTKYRDASREVIAVLCTYSDCVERASIDEAYLDLTQSVKQWTSCKQIKPAEIRNTFVVGYSKDKCDDEGERESGTKEWLTDVYSDSLNDEASKNLAIAAQIVEEIRLEVYQKTGFRCSAGIAHNKILAKLVCGLHKPNRQTVLPHSSVSYLYKSLPVKKIRHLGGKLGDVVMEKLNCSVMADLLPYSEKDLKMKFDEKTGSWLHSIARGIDSEPVKARLVPKSIGCCKRFPGKTSLKSKNDVSYWLNQLTEELTERILEDQTVNKRKAQLLTVSMTLTQHQATSKSLPLTTYDRDKIYNSAYNAVRKIVSDPKEENWSPIFCLGLSASKFMDVSTSGAISNFFHANPSQKNQNASHDLLLNKAVINVTSDTSTSGDSFFSKFIAKDEKEHSRNDYFKLNDNLAHNSINNVTFRNNENFGNSEFFSEHSNGTCQLIYSDDNSCNASTVNNKHEQANYNEKKSSTIQTFYSNCISNSKDNIPIASCSKQSESKLKSNSIQGFFNKQNSTGKEKLNLLEESDRQIESNVKKKSNSIQHFFKNQTGCEVVNPLDVFPDLDVIDEEMLQSFPLSFRRKILELKKVNSKEKSASSNSKCESADYGYRKKNVCDLQQKDEVIIDSKLNSIRSNDGNYVNSSAKYIDNQDNENYDSEQSTESSSENNTINQIENVSSKQDYNWDGEDMFADPEKPCSTSKYFSDVLETCPQCGKQFAKAFIPEHLDFHVAQKLSSEINSEFNEVSSAPFERPSNHSVSAKRKQSGKGRKISETKKFKSLKTFFCT